MLTFLLGRYGTGKSSYILEGIARDVADKRQSFWIVPEQKALICERSIATHLPPSAQFYTEVLNFTRLCDKVFRLSGGLKYNYVTRSGKSLIMYRTLCEVGDSLIEYKVVKGRERGLVELFLDAIGELKSYCVTPEALKEATTLVESERLKNKITDLVRVFETYERILSSRYNDPYDDIVMLNEKLDTCRIFEGANVYISSFDGFTGAQLRVLRTILSQANEVYISLDIDKASLGKIQYAKITNTYDLLRQSARRAGTTCAEKLFDTDLLHKNKALEYLSDNIWSFNARAYEGEAEGITLCRPSDEFDECEIVAGKIKELVMNGARYGEIAVIMRNADTYKGIIDYCFDKYKISYYMSTTTDVSTKPLIKMIYSAVLASCDFTIRDITAFIRSGYADISPEDADELESYIYRWGIYGQRFVNDEFWTVNPDGYLTERTDEQNARLGRILDARAYILDVLMPISEAFKTKKSALEICKIIYELILKLNIREKLKKEIELAKRDEAKELSQLYRATMKALGTVGEILQNEVVDKDGFLSALSYVLSEAKVGTIPTGEDNVTIGEAGSLRTEQIKHAFVLGVCEGAFPQTVVDNSFFSDTDKIELEGASIVLSSLSSERADDELLNFKNSIAIASHTLFVSSPRADIRGGKKEPSMAYKRIKTLFPSLEGSDEVKNTILDKLYTREIASEYLFGSSKESMAIRRALGRDASSVDFSNESAKISTKGASDLFGNSLYLSQSKIEKFVSCHFQYYCTYELGIKDSEKISFGAREVGVLAHSVLEHFLKRIRDGKVDLEALTDDEIVKEIDEITGDYIRALYPHGEPTSKLRHLFNRLKSNILIYIRELAREFAQSEFSPELFEVKFSKSNGIEPLVFDVENGKKITLTGVVDRVDIYKNGDTAYIRVVDYKTGEKKFTFADFDKGLELQMLIYLFTLCKMSDKTLKEKLFGADLSIEPAGVMYFPMRLGKGRSEAVLALGSAEAIELEGKAVRELVKRNGVFLDDEEILSAQDKEMAGEFLPSKSYNKKYYLSREGFDELYNKLEATLKRIGSELFGGDATAKPLNEGDFSECKFCAHRAICRRRQR